MLSSKPIRQQHGLIFVIQVRS